MDSLHSLLLYLLLYSSWPGSNIFRYIYNQIIVIDDNAFIKGELI